MNILGQLAGCSAVNAGAGFWPSNMKIPFHEQLKEEIKTSRSTYVVGILNDGQYTGQQGEAFKQLDAIKVAEIIGSHGTPLHVFIIPCSKEILTLRPVKLVT